MRAPLTVFAIGAGGCVAMGMMMQHLLRVSQERNVSPALVEINRVFGSRFEGEATLRYANRPGGSVAQLTIQPLVVGGGRDLARDVGHFMWRNTDRLLAGVEVVCRDLMGGTDERYTIDRPTLLNTPGVGGGGRATPPKAASAGTPAGKPAGAAPSATPSTVGPTPAKPAQPPGPSSATALSRGPQPVPQNCCAPCAGHRVGDPCPSPSDSAQVVC